MPLPSPRKNQDKDSFVSSCMSDPAMIDEFPDQKRRAAVCFAQHKRRVSGAEDLDWEDWDFEENSYFIFW